VQDIMTPRIDIEALPSGTPIMEAASAIVETGYTRLPVFKETRDNIIGVVHAKDLLGSLTHPEQQNAPVDSIMSQPFFVPETKKIDDLLCDFQTVKVHMAIVVDEFGGVSGLITLEDIIEEIVGEINDEFDEPDTSYEKIGDNVFLFDGRTMLSDFYKITSLDSDGFDDVSGEADTLAGLLLEVKGEFPKLHETIICNGVAFGVEEKDKHRIVKIKVTLPVEDKASDEEV
jgi:CBS domain containing-hemolysin-like protein